MLTSIPSSSWGAKRAPPPLRQAPTPDLVLHFPVLPDPVAGRFLRSRTAAERGEEAPGERRLRVELTKDEIEEDLYSMTGKRAARRPRKRPRLLKQQLDLLFPGFGLLRVVPESYEVRLPAAKQ